MNYFQRRGPDYRLTAHGSELGRHCLRVDPAKAKSERLTRTNYVPVGSIADSVIPVPSPIKLNELAGSTELEMSLLLAPEFRKFPATIVLCNVRVLVLPNSLLAMPPPIPFVPAALFAADGAVTNCQIDRAARCLA